MIGDLDINPRVRGAVSAFSTGAYVYSYAATRSASLARRLIDECEARLEQTPQEPDNSPILGVVDVLRRKVAELLGVLLDGDRPELDPM